MSRGTCRNASYWDAPGALMLDPVIASCVLLTALNDRWLKAIWPGMVTGKLSDLAGLVFFPLLLASFIEIIVSLWRTGWRAGRVCVVVCACVTIVVFSGIQLSAPLSSSYLLATEAILDALLVPFDGRFEPKLQNVADPTDLLALPATWVSVWVATRRRGFAPKARGSAGARNG